MEVIKVLIVDDHTLFRRGIKDILSKEESLEIVGEATDGLDAIKKARTLSPVVILMDLNMPEYSGLDAIQALQAEMPEVNILVLTVSEKESDLFSSIKFGARGYLLKDTEPEELVHAIFHVAQGGVIISPLMATKLLSEFKFKHIADNSEAGSVNGTDTGISSREWEVLQLVADGLSNKEIGDSRFISENTVRAHLHNIMDKLHLSNRTEAAAYAFKKGLIQDKS